MENFVCVSWDDTNFSWNDFDAAWDEACINEGYTCLAWDTTDISWMNLDVTWKEACVLNKIKNHKGGYRHTPYKPSTSGKRYEKRKDDRTEEEAKILITLITRMKENGMINTVEETKEKKPNVKVTSTDLKLFINELRKITINVL